MLKDIVLICVGKIKEDYYRREIDELSRLIAKNARFTIVELPDISIPQNAGEKEEEKIKIEEGKKILSQIKNQDRVHALCINGKVMDNKKLKNLLIGDEYSKYSGEVSDKREVLVIGGSLGLSDEVIKRADTKISFSNMTFPHQLMRVILVEQIYKMFNDK